MAFGKKNEIKLDPLEYNIGLIGESGIGKTTVIKEFCEKLTPADGGYLFAECGKEEGADAIAGINYINCPTWNGEYDDLTNSVGFNILIQDILENKETEYPNLKILVIDTYDQLREIVEPEVIRLHNKQNPEKRVTSVKAAFGGYMAGEDMCDDIILDKLWSLKNVGVHFIVIGHIKQREITDPVTNETYVQLTTDMSMRSFNKIKNKLHFLGVASIDREIVKTKTGKKEKNTIKGETRKITFRDDNYSLDSKSRFADIIDEIPLDSDALIKALTDAIKAEAEKGNKSIDQLEKDQKEREKKVAEKSKQASKEAKESKVDENRNAELVQKITDYYQNSSDKEKKVEIKQAIHDAGATKMNELLEFPTKKVEAIFALCS